jgi:hypothetical protein
VIEDVLKKENVVITASKIRILFKDENGRYSDSDVISTNFLSKVEIKFPVGTMLIPQVQLEPKREPAAPAPAKK